MLLGKRILVTRPVHQTDHFVNHLLTLGASPILFPTTRIAPDQNQQIRLRQELENLNHYQWIIFTSQNAVTLFWEEFQNSELTVKELNNLKVAAIGSATRQVLVQYGVTVSSMPEKFLGEEIVQTLGNIQDAQILLPRAEGARKELVKVLAQNGAIVNEIPLYKSVTNSPDPDSWKELEKGVDYVTFTSASTVSGFFDLLDDRAKTYLSRSITACIGPITANALAQYGITAQIVATTYTTKGLVEAMLAFSSGNDRKAIQ